MQMTATCIACTRGFDDAASFCKSEDPRLALQIDGCREYIQVDTDGDGEIDREDGTAADADETGTPVEAVEDVAVTISCGFIPRWKCLKGVVDYCTWDDDKGECKVKCEVMTRYKCKNQNPLGCHWQPSTSSCDYDSDDDMNRFEGGSMVVPAQSKYEQAAEQADNSIVGLCNTAADCCDPDAKCVTANGDRADALIDSFEATVKGSSVPALGSGSASGMVLGNQKGGANADAVLGKCVDIYADIVVPGLESWPCGARADKATPASGSSGISGSGDFNEGSGNTDFANNNDGGMNPGTTTLVTVIIIGGIVFAAGILAFGMCRRGDHNPAHTLLPMSDLDSGSSATTPMLEKYG